MIKKICIISQRYPSIIDPTVHVFVQKLAWEFANNNIDVKIISPVPINDKNSKKIPQKYTEITDKNKKIEVFRPRYLYFGQKINKPLKLSHLSEHNFFNACKRIIEKNKLDFDVFYGHFICLAGICAARLGKKYNRPSFIAYGESTDWSIKNYGLNDVKNELKNLSGIVSVSTSNKTRLKELNIIDEEKIEVFVNGINTNKFYPRDRIESRKKFGLSKDDFVVSFVGQFIERKGILKLNEALEKIPNVKALYAGSGPLNPQGDFIAFSGKLDSNEIPFLLSASDVFVLPSTNEGCSNAILEAIGCGLPIIAHNGEFNYDILNDHNSIMIDGNNIDEIYNAIILLKNNKKKREEMSKYNQNVTLELSISNRAKKIYNWMNKQYKI